MKRITEDDIIRELRSLYKPTPEREVVKTESMSNYGAVGCTLYALNGSPPKAYALHVPGLDSVFFYDAHGKKRQRREFTSVVVESGDDT
jgi:hypothetical protein